MKAVHSGQCVTYIVNRNVRRAICVGPQLVLAAATCALLPRQNIAFVVEVSLVTAPDAKSGLVPTELAGTVTKTLLIPEIAALRPRLVPEHTIYGWQINTKGEVLVSGIADAVAANSAGKIEVIVDWKSDVVMNVDKLNAYRGQLDSYRKTTGAVRALLVLMTAGRVIELV
jgi:hypothetical protein